LKKYALICCVSSKNWYSYAPLLARLEQLDIFHDLEIFFLKNRSNSNLQNIIPTYISTIFAYSFYTHELPEITAEIKRIREQYSKWNLLFIAGGPHASGNPGQALKLGFDVVVKGEGELTFPLLLERIVRKIPYTDIKGLCFQIDNCIHTSVPSQLLKLDDYPTFSQPFNLYPPLEITRGCPFGCKYCQVTYLFGRTVRHRSIETILKIVRAYQRVFAKRRSTDIRFISPNSLAYGSADGRIPNPSKIKKLLKCISDLGNIRIFFATFPSETRPEFINSSLLNDISPYLSNTQIAFGAQSGSDRILQLIGRSHTVEAIKNAAQIILDANLTPIIDFILGLPHEKLEDQYQTLEVIKDLVNDGSKIRIHYFMPLPGTPFENAQPVPIAPPILSDLGRYAKKGYLKGNLDAQIKNSKRIVDLLKGLN